MMTCTSKALRIIQKKSKEHVCDFVLSYKPNYSRLIEDFQDFKKIIIIPGRYAPCRMIWLDVACFKNIIL